jgi:glycogen debranching enzyme
VLHQDLVLKHDELYLVGESKIEGSEERATGLYAHDTRFLHHWELRIDDRPLEPLVAHVLGADRALVVSANSALPAAGGRLPEPVRPLTIAVEEAVRLGANLRVQVTLTNYSGRTLPLTVSLEIGGDFRDLFDIRGFPRRERGGAYLQPVWRDRELILGYVDRSGAVANLRIAFSQSPLEPLSTTVIDAEDPDVAVLLPGFDHVWELPPLPPPPCGKALYDITLEQGGSWDVDVTLTPVPAGELPISVIEEEREPGRRGQTARLMTDHPGANRTLERATDDLAMLWTSFRDGTLSAAGIPWFVAPFGRDSLIVALQTLHVAPRRAVETLRTLARLQGRGVDAFREEEPGKILHEMRYGEMTRLGEVPHAPYFGSVDATPLFVMLFAATVRWTGDETLYHDLLPNARRALEWIEHWGDRDHDGFVEYGTQLASAAHIVHRGWKDSFDSLHTADGAPVFGNVALVEVQGYVYAAFRWLSEVAEHFGDTGWAAELRQRADRVQQLVEERFWLPDEGYYAQALDGEARPVAAIASNPGHLLYCGLPSPERARLVAQRLSVPDLASGWGIRTLASGMATYNPMSYHNGSVWPHDNSLIVAGLSRYGEDEGLTRVATAIFAAAERLPGHRLPELYCGFSREQDAAATSPVPYPVSCRPQAWAAGAPFLLMRAVLGLEIDLPRAALCVDPVFPAWMNHVRVTGMEALGQRVDLDVVRDGAGYRITGDGPIEIVGQESYRVMG